MPAAEEKPNLTRLDVADGSFTVPRLFAVPVDQFNQMHKIFFAEGNAITPAILERCLAKVSFIPVKKVQHRRGRRKFHSRRENKLIILRLHHLSLCLRPVIYRQTLIRFHFYPPEHYYRLQWIIMNDYSDVYLTPEQIAEKLQVVVETIYRWLRSGKLRGSRISPKAWRVSERELASFMRRQNVSELLFEDYVTEHSLGTLEHEPPHPGTLKLIDYRLHRHGQILWFEVKEFDDDERLSSASGGYFDPYVTSAQKLEKRRRSFAVMEGSAAHLSYSTRGPT